MAERVAKARFYVNGAIVVLGLVVSVYATYTALCVIIFYESPPLRGAIITGAIR